MSDRRMANPEAYSGMNEMPKGMDTTHANTKLEDALATLRTSLAILDKTVGTFHEKLQPVLNNYPREVEETMNKPSPSGDSMLLVALYTMKEDVGLQTEHLNSLIERLDI